MAVAFLSFTAGYAWGAAPAAPTGLVSAAASSRQINLSWTDNATDETNYYVERSPNGSSSWTVIATLGSNATGYQDIGLIQSMTYYYRVRCKSKTYSNYSNTANAPTATLAAPTGLTLTVASASQVNLTWIDNTAYETNYYVERAASSGGPYTQVGSVGANVTSYSDSGLSIGSTYYYRVRAYDGTNYSAYSGAASIILDITPPTTSLSSNPTSTDTAPTPFRSGMEPRWYLP